MAVQTADIELGEQVADGKTKTLYANRDSGGGRNDELVYMVHKDSITAGDGAKRDVIENKGELSCRTTSAVFRLLESAGIPTHYVSTPAARIMIVRRVEMIPIEWVARRIATGSYVRRTSMAEGTRFDDLVLETFLKDDANHDPLISREDAVSRGICSALEVEQALAMTTRIFEILEAAWAEQDIQLVDLKVEFGRMVDRLLLADVIDNDSWRLWPGGQREQMLDKQVYRELSVSTQPALADVKRRYQEVAERAQRLGQLVGAGTPA